MQHKQFLVLLLVGLSGLISLSYEILWVRVASFSSMGSAQAFPMTLGLFLLGIALGARLSKRFSQRYEERSSKTLAVVAVFWFLSNVAGWLVIPIIARYLTLSDRIPFFTSLYFVCIAAAMLGAQFPLLTHYGIDPDKEAGQKLSYYYVSNIIGSVGGSLLTGFVLLDHFSLPTITTGLACVGIVMSVVVYVLSRPPKVRMIQASVVALVCMIGFVALHGPMFDQLYERLLYKGKFDGSQRFKHLLENKSSVIAVTQGDRVYGGGTYDGDFSLDIHNDVNGIRRPFSISAFHPNPKRVLVIGVASGSWLKIIAEHPQVEEIVAIEINPGYLDVIKRYPSHADLLKDPKVTMVIDDGRRWLHRNDKKFDLVVTNNTHHWHPMATNLLSVEFFSLLKDDLRDDGVITFNTTGSDRVFATANSVFEETYRIFNNGVSSPSTIDFDPKRLEEVLRQYKVNGQLVFNPNDPKHEEHLKEFIQEFSAADNSGKPDAATSIVEAPESIKKRTNHLKVYTDRSMGDEYNLSRVLFGGK